MNYYKTKDIKIDGLLKEIEDALSEDRYVVYEVTSTCGIIYHNSGYFNIEDAVILKDDKDGSVRLRIIPRSSKVETPNVHIDITNEQNYHITNCGANGGIRDPKHDRMALCRLYKLDTRQTNVDGLPLCTIRFHIEERRKINK